MLTWLIRRRAAASSTLRNSADCRALDADDFGAAFGIDEISLTTKVRHDIPRAQSANVLVLKSRTKRTRQTLDPTRAEEVLRQLANIPDMGPAGTVVTAHTPFVALIERIRSRYPEFRKCSDSDMFALRHLLRQAWMSPDFRAREWFCFSLRRFHAETMGFVQDLEKDDGQTLVQVVRDRKSKIDDILQRSEQHEGPFTLSQLSYFHLDGEQYYKALKENPPPLTDFESIAFYLQRNLQRALYCQNPGCHTPYFFLTRKGQRYCSPECAQYGQRESKKKWWQENRGRGKGAKRRGRKK